MIACVIFWGEEEELSPNSETTLYLINNNKENKMVKDQRFRILILLQDVAYELQEKNCLQL